MQRTLSLANVSFTWSRGTVQFAGVDLTLERGRIVGLTGANGAGKTTLVKLLRREYEPTAGKVLVDDRDASDIDLREFRSSIALLASDVAIFAGSLYDNIALHRPAVTPQRIVDLVANLGLGPFMQRFPAGLATSIGEDGRQLSAGERYIVGLLRALVVQARVLIVDEAFAMLDATVFRIMLGAILRFATTNAVLLISHDPSVLAHAHEVFTLEAGRVVRAPLPDRSVSVPAREENLELTPVG
jgi:ATP-binding cassette, subfamily B, bacterial